MREHRGLSQSELARRMRPERPHGIRVSISRWERGHESPTVQSILRLAAALGVDNPAALCA